MKEARALVTLLGLAVLGLAAGVWQFLAPWVVGLPKGAGGWSTATWASVWTAAVIVSASGLVLVLLAGALARATSRRQDARIPAGRTEELPGSEA